jgi:hypothetical protein
MIRRILAAATAAMALTVGAPVAATQAAQPPAYVLTGVNTGGGSYGCNTAVATLTWNHAKVTEVEWFFHYNSVQIGSGWVEAFPGQVFPTGINGKHGTVVSPQMSAGGLSGLWVDKVGADLNGAPFTGEPQVQGNTDLPGF